jgi:Tfp pilus assembly protein PilX
LLKNRRRRFAMNAMKTNMRVLGLHSQQGAALVIAVLILLILTVIGVYAVTTSTLETKITGFHKWHVEAFYAADAGIDYAMAQCPFGTLNPDTPTWNPPDHHGPEFDVTATYRGETLPPVGSGTGTRAGLKAHHYQVDSIGQDQADIARSTVHMWGYRLGF